jgi:hypothetical protein
VLHTGALLLLFLLAPAVSIAAVPPSIVSPGAENDVLMVEGRCPTFSWGLVAGARRYELEVVGHDRVEDRSAARRSTTDPVIFVELPGSASSWTPGDPLCLERGRAYTWRLRAHELVGAGPWSPSLAFGVAGAEPGGFADESVDEPFATETVLDTADVDSAALWSSAGADGSSSRDPESRALRISAASVDLAELLGQLRVTSERFTSSDAAAVVGVQTMDFPLPEGQTGYGVLGVAIDESGNSSTVGVRGEAFLGAGVEGEGSVGVRGSGVDGVLGTGSLRGGSFTGTGTGVGLRARGATNAVPDVVLGGNSASNDDGVIRSDPSFSGSDLFLSSGDAVVIQLDVDADTADSDFVVQDENGVNLFEVDDSGAVRVLGAIVHGSDRERKTLHRRVDTRALLELLARLPLYEWSWRTDPGETHLGPTAQDFQELFGLGSDPRSFATIDMDGVALAAIQGLHELVAEQRREIERLRREIASARPRRGSTERPLVGLGASQPTRAPRRYPRSLRRQARARIQSLCTVRSEAPSDLAVSSSVMPAK